MGREQFNLPSWPLYPFGNRPQQLPPPSLASYLGMMSGEVTLSPMFLEMLERTEQQPTAMPGGTVRLERDGVAVDLYFPTDDDRATLSAALPGCDLENPPWHAVQVRLVQADLSPDWEHLRAPAAVALLPMTSTPPAAALAPGTEQSEGEDEKPPSPGDANATDEREERSTEAVKDGLDSQEAKEKADDAIRRAKVAEMQPAQRKAYWSREYAKALASQKRYGRETQGT